MNRKLELVIFFVGVCFSLITTVFFGEPGLLWIILLFFIIGFVYRDRARNIYFLAFSANIIFGCILIWVFQSNNSFFDSGGDDAKFFSYFNRASEGYDVLFKIRYGNFILLGATFIDFLKFFGINEPSPILLYPLNWFYGANVCALTYILGLQLGLSKNGAFVSSSLLAVYPNFVFYEAKMLREILVTLFFILFFVTYYSRLKLYLKFFIVLAIFLVFTRLRNEYIIYLMFFIAVDVLYELYHRKQRALALIIVVSGIIILILGYNTFLSLTGRGSDDITKYSETYSELRSSDSNSNSLAASLKNAGGVFYIVTLLYLWISPFPPPVFIVYNWIYIIISIGVIFWYKSYLKFPFLTLSYIKTSISNPRLKKTIIKLLIFILGCSIIISVTTADARHLISFYPLVFLVFNVMESEYPRSKNEILNQATWILALLLFLIYAGIKSS